MNERIKQLADDAGFLMWDGEEHAPVDAVVDWSCSYDYELEKFAELIVRECLGCCEQVISDPVAYHQSLLDFEDAIKENERI